MECPRWTRPQFTTLAEFLKNDSDFQSCMIYGSESLFFGLKMGGVQKMHLMMVSTTFLEKMSYHLEANFSTLAKNTNSQMRKKYQLLFGNPLAVDPRKLNITRRCSNGKKLPIANGK